MVTVRPHVREFVLQQCADAKEEFSQVFAVDRQCRLVRGARHHLCTLRREIWLAALQPPIDASLHELAAACGLRSHSSISDCLKSARYLERRMLKQTSSKIEETDIRVISCGGGGEGADVYHRLELASPVGPACNTCMGYWKSEDRAREAKVVLCNWLREKGVM